jgi:hypothetical protein
MLEMPEMDKPRMKKNTVRVSKAMRAENFEEFK